MPWFVMGLAFECQECGRCCCGPEEGYVWATEEEMGKIADFLEMSKEDFFAKYVRKIGTRYSLIEDKTTKDCIFVKDGKCSVYSVRPTQCRTWPFWPSNLYTPEDWGYAGLRCDGINRGKLFSQEEIIDQASRTEESD